MNTHLLSTSKLLVSLLLCILASSPTVLGQGNFGSITGGVYDATGAVIPGVRITAIGLETGLQLSTETTTVGSYLIPNLPERRVPRDGNRHGVQDVHAAAGHRIDGDRHHRGRNPRDRRCDRNRHGRGGQRAVGDNHPPALDP